MGKSQTDLSSGLTSSSYCSASSRHLNLQLRCLYEHIDRYRTSCIKCMGAIKAVFSVLTGLEYLIFVMRS